MAANNQTLYIYRGEEGEAVPDDATHVLVDLSVRVVLSGAFRRHQNIVEVDCRNAEKIEAEAFRECPSLRRVKMRGVIIVEWCAFRSCDALTDVECGKLETIELGAFDSCYALTDVECDKLERIDYRAFGSCKSLRSINLPSVNIVEAEAFYRCEALTNVKFGEKLERIGGGAFGNCESLERITLPLKYDVIEDDDDDGYYHDVFQGCKNLRRVDLVGGVHEFVAALPLDEWKNEMNAKINSINRILPNTSAGEYNYDRDYVEVAVEKGRAIQTWIRSVLHKIVDYKQQHRNLLTEATTILVEEVGLPREIVMNYIPPCLQLPSYEFELKDGGTLILFYRCCFICVAIALLLKYPTRSASNTTS
jgi:hypothetical protein